MTAVQKPAPAGIRWARLTGKGTARMQNRDSISVTPFLWFDDDLDEAVDLYARVFPKARVEVTTRGPDGKVVVAEFEIAGQRVMAINGGPHFPQTEAFSFYVRCPTQDEVDYFWRELAAGGGRQGNCGWLKDRFGVSWQIVPAEFPEMMATGSPEQVIRVGEAMLGMSKLDVAELRAAFEGGGRSGQE